MRVLYLPGRSSHVDDVRASLHQSHPGSEVEISTPEAAAAWLSSHPECDAVLVDGDALPTDGQGIAALRAGRSDIPIAVLVAPGDTPGEARALLAGADASLPQSPGTLERLGSLLVRMRRRDADPDRRDWRLWFAGRDTELRRALAARLGRRALLMSLSRDGKLVPMIEDPASATALVVDAREAGDDMLAGLQRVRDLHPTLATIVVAADAYHSAFLRMGADDCLPPGTDVERLLLAVESVSTQRQLAAEVVTLRARENRLRAVVEYLPEAVVLVAPSRAVLAINLAGLELVGAAEARHVIGRELSAWLVADPGDDFGTFVDAVSAGAARELTVTTRHAEPQRVQLRAVPFQREPGRPASALITMRLMAAPAAIAAPSDATATLPGAAEAMAEAESLRQRVAELEAHVSQRTETEQRQRELVASLEHELAVERTRTSELTAAATDDRADLSVSSIVALEQAIADQRAHADELTAALAAARTQLDEVQAQLAAATTAGTDGDDERRALDEALAAARAALDEERAAHAQAQTARQAERIDHDDARQALDAARAEAEQARATAASLLQARDDRDTRIAALEDALAATRTENARQLGLTRDALVEQQAETQRALAQELSDLRQALEHERREARQTLADAHADLGDARQSLVQTQAEAEEQRGAVASLTEARDDRDRRIAALEEALDATAEAARQAAAARDALTAQLTDTQQALERESADARLVLQREFADVRQSLERERDDRDRRIAALEAALAAAQEQAAAEAARARTELEALASERDARDERITTLEAVVAAAQATGDEQLTALRAALEQARTEAGQAQAEAEQERRTVTSLTEARDDRDRRVTALEAALAAAQEQAAAEAARARTELEALASERDARDERITTLEAAVAAAQATGDEQLTALRAALEQAQAEAEQERRTVTSLTEARDDRDRRVAALEHDLAVTRGALEDELATTRAALEGELAEARAALDEAHAAVGLRAVAEQEALAQQLAAFERLSELEATLAGLQEAADSARATTETERAAREAAVRDRDGRDERIAALEAYIGETRVALERAAAIDGELAETRAALGREREERAERADQVRVLEQALMDARVAASAAETRAQLLQEEAEARAGALDRSRHDGAALREALATLERESVARLRQLEEERDALRRDAGQWQTVRAELPTLRAAQQQVTALEGQLAETQLVRAQAIALETELAELRETRAYAQRLEAELADARAALEARPGPPARLEAAVDEETRWLLYDVASIGHLTTTPEARILGANDIAAQLLGHFSRDALQASGRLPEPLLEAAGAFAHRPTRFEVCLQHGDEGPLHWIVGLATPHAGVPATVTWMLIDVSEQRMHARRSRFLRRMEAMTHVLSAATAESSTLVERATPLLEAAASSFGTRDDLDVDGTREALTRTQSMLMQLSAFARKRARRTGVRDVRALLDAAGPVLVHVAGEDVACTITPSDEPLHATLELAEFEQFLTALVMAGREALPLGGRLTLGTSAINADTRDDGAFFMRPTVEISLRAEGYGAQLPTNVPALQEAATRFGATLSAEFDGRSNLRLVVRMARVFVMT